MRIMVVYSFWMFCVLQAVLNGEETFRRVRVASISFRPVKLDLAGNTDKLESMFRQAARGGAKISVAPEGILEGYIVNEIIADKFDQDRMRQVAVTIDSPTIRRFRDLAEELDMCLVFGFAEKVGEDVLIQPSLLTTKERCVASITKCSWQRGTIQRGGLIAWADRVVRLILRTVGVEF